MEVWLLIGNRTVIKLQNVASNQVCEGNLHEQSFFVLDTIFNVFQGTFECPSDPDMQFAINFNSKTFFSPISNACSGVHVIEV